ncbi:MAG: membrane protein insertase YidC [wastewater metagenome]|nr:membrane protein insertase YidC [Candidatus Loosdrechtia aerotolerans]
MDRKALIAIIICGIIMLLYYPFILPLLSPRKPAPEGVKEEVVIPEEPQEEKAAQVRPKPIQTQPQEDIHLKDVVIENELVRMVWTNEGAAVKSVELKRFKDTETKGILDLVKKDVETTYLPLAIDNIFQEEDFRRRRYIVREQTRDKVVFTTSLGEGINIIKTVSLPPHKYHVGMDIVLENTTDTDLSLTYDLIASSLIAEEGEPSADMAAVAGLDTGGARVKLLRTALKNLPFKNESVGITWAGSMNKYFATVLKPSSGELIKFINAQALNESGALSGEEAKNGNFIVSLHTNKFRLPSQGTAKQSYLYFMGPKKEEVLEQYDTLEVLLSYGWLSSISKVLLSFLNAVHRMIPNYGVSIIILTIIIKALLFPLTRKSQVSMFRMQQLQPMINQLKEKYKHDKQKMGKEQMLLFKKYGVNPMSGCFPMLLQLPVFFALFRTLQLSFEMRQAPFVLWIDDLSRPDTLMMLPFHIPLLGNSLNILPLIMTGASFAQMKLTPKAPATDPQAQAQQKMMSFMPIMFAFILYSMPSGLTLYWTVSTVLSIIEGIIIRKSLGKIKPKYK